MKSDSDLLEKVRRTCRTVAEKALWVEIDPTGLQRYAEFLSGEKLDLQMDPLAHVLNDGDRTIAFFLILDAVNFGSGYFPEIYPRQRSGYLSIAEALTKFFESQAVPTTDFLVRLAPEDCGRIFDLDPANAAARELSRLFARSLNDLGRFLSERFRGDFAALVRASEHSAAKLMEILAEMHLFRDTEAYGDLTVHFYKRAQLAAADLFIAFGGKGPGRFDDIDRLTACADNLVPHVLRVDGILRYSRILEESIGRGDFLPSGSAEEVEIRACSVHGVELLVEELRRRGRLVSPMVLDNFLWHRGHLKKYRRAPRHRTLTVFY